MLEVGHQQRANQLHNSNDASRCKPADKADVTVFFARETADFARSIALKVMNKLAVPLNDDQIEKVFTSVDLNKDSQLDSQAEGLRAELPTVNHGTLRPNCQVVFGLFCSAQSLIGQAHGWL